jgi:dienelactone hydrolase
MFFRYSYRLLLLTSIYLSCGSLPDSKAEIQNKAFSVHSLILPVPPQEYPVATSPFFIPPEKRPGNVTWPNYRSGRNGVYVSELLEGDTEVFRVVLQPEDSVLFPQTAGTSVPLIGYITFPTTAGNTDADYGFSRASIQLPRMTPRGAKPVFADTMTGFPLVILSHGYGSDPLNRQALIKFLAQRGFVVLALFHGDGRFADYREQLALRLLSLSRAIKALQEDPAYTSYAQNIDFERIGVIGVSFGGAAAFYAQKALIENGPEPLRMPEYAEFGAAVSLIPVVGPSPWEEGLHTQEVETPLLFISGQYDEIAPQAEAFRALSSVPAPTRMFSVLGAGHLVDTPLMGALAVWHFREHLFMDQKAKVILDQITGLEGLRDFERILLE